MLDPARKHVKIRFSAMHVRGTEKIAIYKVLPDQKYYFKQSFYWLSPQLVRGIEKFAIYKVLHDQKYYFIVFLLTETR